MVFNLFGEITTLSKTAPNSMPYFTIITFGGVSKSMLTLNEAIIDVKEG